ncbi:MAG: hydroxymethylglutaryl-CoA lyase [Myxococcota bacterium]|nr:hydroxymethylglutaryl-CoA lyase [Myxococcota bacterium]
MIRIVEVGPRDGLQNEPVPIPTEAKVAFVDALSEIGAADIEVSAFVSPKWVPQLWDAKEVFEQIKRNEDITYSALVPNERGLERAMEAKADKIAVFTAASEGFSGKNTNCSIDTSFERIDPVITRAQAMNLPVRGYVSTAFWCPYEGRIAPEKAADVIERLADYGVTDVSVGDTIGKASPDEVKALLDIVLKRVPAERIAMHFHDTYGRAPQNVVASWEYGIEIYDACTGGIGGCPYAPGASGNVATGTVVRTLRAVGADVRIDFEALESARQRIIEYLCNAGAENALAQGEE